MTTTIRGGKVLFELLPEDPATEIKQNVALFLSTRRGTVPMYRGYGLPGDFLDKPTPAAKAMLTAAVVEGLREYEPRCRVTAVQFDEDGEGGIVVSGRLKVEG